MIDFEKYMIANVATESIGYHIDNLKHAIRKGIRNLTHPGIKKEIANKAKEYEKLPAKELITQLISITRPILNTTPTASKVLKQEVPGTYDGGEKILFGTIAGVPLAYVTDGTGSDAPLLRVHFCTYVPDDVKTEIIDGKKTFIDCVLTEFESNNAAKLVADPMEAKRYVSSIMRDIQTLKAYEAKNKD